MITLNPPLESRSPHGGRGLKLRIELALCRRRKSLPARGAWIETLAERTL
ncbi:Uncharacterized protein dnm_098790 [Desulfonema magnum]|uniref:Uncharacterized protein n=1 Tax=Desulfonema magnum TaxID=45655 RepID=A0A975BXR2_9BACT|nr:Uncharacterized protein dnm_098790 [Desulfonema magnum]